MSNNFSFTERWSRPRDTVVTNNGAVVFEQHLVGVASAPRTRTGSSLPNYRDIIARRGNATTVLSQSRAKFKFRDPTLSIQWHRVTSPASQYLTVVSGTPDTLITVYPGEAYDASLQASAENQANTMFFKNLSKANSRFQGLPFLGELRETLEMIRSPAKAFRQKLSEYARSLKSARKSAKRWHRRDWHKVIADTYLEHAFGWQPLIGDTIDAAKALSNVLNGFRQHTVRGFGKAQKWDPTEVAIVSDPLTYTCWTLETRSLSEYQVRVKGGLSEKIAGPEPDVSFFEQFGLTVNQFIPSIWELLPWSFVVDYFVNVGDVLNASFTDTSKLQWTSTSRKRRHFRSKWLTPNREQSAAVLAYNGAVIDGFSGRVGRSTCVVDTYDRTGAGPSIPSLVTSMPPFDSMKWVNLGALATQLREVAYTRKL